MFGRKKRQIANQAIMIATARKESHDMLAKLVEKNNKIIELGEAGRVADEVIRGLNGKINELMRLLERERKDVRTAEENARRAEGAADAAIQAGGIIGDQLHAAQAQLTARDATITGLTAEVEDLKGAKWRLMEALRQARAHANAIADADERKPGKPGTPQSRLPRLDVQQDVAQLLDEAMQTKKDTPALQNLHEEIAKARYEEGVMPIPDEWRVNQSIPLPKRTPGALLSHGFTDHGHPCCDDAPRKAPPNTKVYRCGGTRRCDRCREDRDRWHSLVAGGVVSPGKPTQEQPAQDAAELAKETT